MRVRPAQVLEKQRLLAARPGQTGGPKMTMQIETQDQPLGDAAPAADEADPVWLAVGQVVRFSPGLRTGTVRIAGGRNVEFDLRFVEVRGPGRRFPTEWLRLGLEVGYDVAWTQRGLRVCTLFPLPQQ